MADSLSVLKYCYAIRVITHRNYIDFHPYERADVVAGAQHLSVQFFIIAPGYHLYRKTMLVHTRKLTSFAIK